ncbi:MAG: phage integrase SAM-like domain-containing protein, partial [Treponema sp.]|nr:phage integrase SAM-like domain-containing protein [Treponema sp.]
MPFLKERHIICFEDITPPLIAGFQNYLPAQNLKPRTVNDYMRGVSAVFAHLTMTGVIRANVFKMTERLEAKPEDGGLRGCHDVSTVQGVFSKHWEDPLS